MVAARSLSTLALLALLAAAAAAPRAAPHRARRQLADDNTLQPIETGTTWRRREATGAATAGAPPSWSRRSRPTRSTGSSALSPGRPRRRRQATDDIPVFDRNKVSLDVPGSLFGPSVSLLIRTTKIIGDVIQNSAVRYQTFLRLFRPLFRGPFEIKGLDPPTTTTTTTSAPAPADSAADNEVRRR